MKRRNHRLHHHSHHHFGELVVTKNELIYQLSQHDRHNDLIKLLIFGKELHDYDICLMKASIKYGFLSSLVYRGSRTSNNKPPIKHYVRYVFEGGYENYDEVKENAEALYGKELSDEDAKRIFRKYLFAMIWLCQLMAFENEIMWSCYHKIVIEYAIEHDDFNIPDCYCIRQALDKNFYERKINFNELFASYPEPDKIIECDFDYGRII